MELNTETLLTGCYWTAFILAFALPILLPALVAAAAMASTLCSVIWALRVMLRLYRAPSVRCASRQARRPFIAEIVRLCLLE